MKKYLFIILIAFTTTLALPACSGGKETKKVERRTEQTKVTEKTEPKKVQSPKTSTETTNLETVGWTDGTDSYIFNNNDSGDSLVKLAGISTLVGVNTSATTAANYVTIG